MPKKVHDKLVKQAAQKGLVGARRDAYVYGTLRDLMHYTPKEKRPHGR